ncbi:hypothetical protein TTHERM_00989310 (macronuclear) [Tetrahymena thermophila SB210]|uniref:Uncharacterized protein n=1 Tax=Tetrahymena thermophila (strain SB210) TaxID=312017 RepID=Q240L8_TETTS|nr:hypothetical protein TTHERM_00989310 [Tetrahymena thermophila SB210]EAS02190.2 hypothetical protein TTHERM_00989310 [Tetrahymena thermophila SB210]|eukprot:XP_001022435.2 hypothetical protein TTHERM_00989310 [Tetrahymena thermophila SB210]
MFNFENLFDSLSCYMSLSKEEKEQEQLEMLMGQILEIQEGRKEQDEEILNISHNKYIQLSAKKICDLQYDNPTQYQIDLEQLVDQQLDDLLANSDKDSKAYYSAVKSFLEQARFMN